MFTAIGNETGGANVLRVLARSCAPAILAIVAAMSAGTARAVQLNDIRPDRIKSFVQADKVTVVLFTSPDEKCGFCVGALGAFNKAAVRYKDEPPVFAYVQWKPWRAFPAMDLPRPVYGIPHVKIFRKGEVLAEFDGRLADTDKLVALVDEALAGKLKPLPAASAPAEAAASVAAGTAGPGAASKVAGSAATPAWTDPDRAAVSLYLRQELLASAARRCAQRHPDQAGDAAQAEAAWQARHGSGAGRGLLLAMAADSRTELRAAIDPLGKAQAAQLDAQLRLKADMAADDCQGLYRFMARDPGPSPSR